MRWRGAAFAMALLPWIAGCGRPAAATSEPEVVTVRVSGRPILTNAPLLIADAEGDFADQRLRLEWAELSTSTTQAIPVLAQGRIDVIAGSVSSGLINALGSGAPIRIVADKGHIAPGHCAPSALVVRRAMHESGAIRTLADVRGRRMVVNEVGVAGYYLEKLLGSAGMTYDDVITVKIPYASMAQALTSGSVDVASATEPWMTTLVDAGHVVLAQSASVTPRAQSAVLIFGPSLWRDNPDVGRRFMRAYLRGVRRYSDGKTARNLEILAERLKMPRDLLSRMCWAAIHQDARVDTESLMHFQQWAIAKGYLKTPIPASALWDSTFAVEALAESSNDRSDAR